MHNINQLQQAFENLYSCSFKKYKTKCPFHQDKTASLSLYYDNNKPRYKCFGCSNSGDIWDLHVECYGADFKESARLVKENFGIDPPIKMNEKEDVLNRNDAHIESAIKLANTNKLIYVTSYRYSNTNYKHRFKDKNGNKTFRHTYFDSEKNKIVSSESELNENDRNLISKIYKKSNIDYAFSHNLNFYICEGEKDVDNISKLGFSACHIETGKEEELNKMLQNYTSYKGKIFHVYDNEISRVGINKAYNRAKAIDYNKQYLIEPKEKDISDDIDLYGIHKTKDEIEFQSKENLKTAYLEGDNAYEYYTNKRGEKVMPPSEYNIEKFYDINLRGTLCVDCITKRSVILHNYGEMSIYSSREDSAPYFHSRAAIRKFGRKLTSFQIKNIIDDIWNKRKINLFDVMLKKHRTNDMTEFNRFINDFYNSLDKSFTSKKEFEELFTFFFTRTIRRAIDYGKRPNQCLKMIFTIIGQQSCGKSRFVENIFYDMGMHDFVKAGCTLGNLSRDDIMIVTSAPIIELAETTSLLRSAKYSEDLKRFISQSCDSYRAPYEREAKSHPRISSYIYTTNQEVILRDKTGNTRFYTIRAIKEMPDPSRYDMKKVWGYLYSVATRITSDELPNYYQIPEILKKYIERSSGELFDTSPYCDELYGLEKEEDEYMVYNKTELQTILQIKDRKSSLDFFSSLEIKGNEYKAYKIYGNRVVRGYLLNKIKLFPTYGQPFIKRK